MKRLMRVSLVVAFFPIMVGINSWFFKSHLGLSYVDWYIKNGTLISLTASLFAVVWKDLNKNEHLIASNPLNFLGANLQLLGSQFSVIGNSLERAGRRFRAHEPLRQSDSEAGKASRLIRYRADLVPLSDLFDGAASLLASIVMVSALTVWFLAVVPLQYFVVLIAGAPARLGLKLGVPMVEGDGADAEAGRQWWVNFHSAPISTTNVIAGFAILTVKLVREGIA